MWLRFLIDHMFFRKRHWHLIRKWTLGLLNALNHHWCVTSDYLKLFWSMWCPKISFLRILCVRPVLYYEEIYGIVSYLIFSISFYTFKKKTLACGSQEGHNQIALWVSGSIGSASVTHLQPWFWLTLDIKTSVTQSKLSSYHSKAYS